MKNYRKYAKFLLMALLSTSGFLASHSVAAVITLTFDEFTHQEPISNEYQAFGITVLGANAYDSNNVPVEADTPPNVAYSPTGSMSYILDLAITGQVVGFSGFLYGFGTPVSFLFYDDANAPLGAIVFPSPTAELLVSFSSPGASIARVDVVGSGADYGIDTLRFSTERIAAEPIDEPTPLTLLIFGGFVLGGIRRWGRSMKYRDARGWRLGGKRPHTQA